MENLNKNNQNTDLFDSILRKVDIVDIIGHYLNLEKKGRNYAALCPFHDDKQLGNFFVSQEKQVFKCFACNKSGNAIAFVKEKERCSWIEAAKKVCEIANIVEPGLENFKETKKDPKVEKTLQILKDISLFYSLSLFQSDEGKDALNYLHNRGLNDDIIRHFGIGYALKDGSKVIEFLTKEKNYSLKEIDETGIIDLKHNVIKDKNYGRIAFFIKNSNNEVCGFSCRIFGDKKSDAKYVNTSSTIVFNKSNILYNYFDAISESAKVGYVYLLEGFMDVIACYRANIKSAVGLMGTSLTKNHLKMLKDLKCEVRLCLDLDKPGQNAMYKAFPLLESYSIPYRVVNNDVDFNYKDSDEIIDHLGNEKLISYLSNVTDKLNWLVNYFKKNLDLNILENKEKMINFFVPILKNNADQILVDSYIKELEKVTNVSYNVIKDMIDKAKLDTSINVDNFEIEDKEYIDEFESSKNEIKRTKLRESKIIKSERLLLSYMLKNEEAISIFKEKMNSFYTPIFSELYEIVSQYINEKNDFAFSKDKLENIVNSSSCDKKEDLKIEISKIFTLKNYDSYSKDIVEELIENIKFERNLINIKKSNQELLKNKNGNSDEYLLSLLSSSKNKMAEKTAYERGKYGKNSKKIG